MNLLSIFRDISCSSHISCKATNKTRYFVVLPDFQFSTLVPIQVIPVGVERSNETPTGTSRKRGLKLI